MKSTKKVYMITGCVMLMFLVIAAIAINKPANVEATHVTQKETVKYVKTALVRSTDEGIKRTYPGVVHANRKANLFFRVSGPVIEINISPGDVVKKEQVLMRIDPRDYQNKKRSAHHAYQASLAKLEAMKNGARPEDIAILNSELEAAIATKEELQCDYQRIKVLYKKKVVSEATHDHSKSQYTIAKAKIAVLKQQLIKAKRGARREDIKAAEAQCSQLKNALKIANDQLEDTILKAPFSGIVTRQFIEKYEMARHGETVLAMHNINKIDIVIDVPEKAMHLFRDMKKIEFNVTFALLPGKKFPARISEWNSEAAATMKTYELTLTMEQLSDVRILPGMTAEATGLVPNGKAVAIPSSAIVSDSEKSNFVWQVDENGNVHKQTVELAGFLNQNMVKITNGLTCNQRIVVGGANFIVPGMAVRDLYQSQQQVSK